MWGTKGSEAGAIQDGKASLSHHHISDPEEASLQQDGKRQQEIIYPHPVHRDISGRGGCRVDERLRDN